MIDDQLKQLAPHIAIYQILKKCTGGGETIDIYLLAKQIGRTPYETSNLIRTMVNDGLVYYEELEVGLRETSK